MNKRKLLCSSICLCLANFAFVEAALAKNSGGNPCKALKNDPNVVVVSDGVYDGSAETEGMTIIGSNRADDITGTPYNDVICGNNGNDTVRGGDGADTIYGGNGNDTLYGDEGLATPTACALPGEYVVGACDDKIAGNNGKDTIYGENGDDELAGGTGKDMLYGDFMDNVTCLGGSTVDMGGVLTDVLNCDDTLMGGNGKDALNGGPGNDSLNGGRSKDQCTGTADDILGGIVSCETTL